MHEGDDCLYPASFVGYKIRFEFYYFLSFF